MLRGISGKKFGDQTLSFSLKLSHNNPIMSGVIHFGKCFTTMPYYYYYYYEKRSELTNLTGQYNHQLLLDHQICVLPLFDPNSVKSLYINYNLHDSE